MKEIVARGARYTVHDIARMSDVSLSRVHNILKNILNIRKISATWVPHLLTDGQKRQRTEAKALAQNISKIL